MPTFNLGERKLGEGDAAILVPFVEGKQVKPTVDRHLPLWCIGQNQGASPFAVVVDASLRKFPRQCRHGGGRDPRRQPIARPRRCCQHRHQQRRQKDQARAIRHRWLLPTAAASLQILRQRPLQPMCQDWRHANGPEEAEPCGRQGQQGQGNKRRQFHGVDSEAQSDEKQDADHERQPESEHGLENGGVPGGHPFADAQLSGNVRVEPGDFDEAPAEWRCEL